MLWVAFPEVWRRWAGFKPNFWGVQGQYKFCRCNIRIVQIFLITIHYLAAQCDNWAVEPSRSHRPTPAVCDVTTVLYLLFVRADSETMSGWEYKLSTNFLVRLTISYDHWAVGVLWVAYPGVCRRWARFESNFQGVQKQYKFCRCDIRRVQFFLNTTQYLPGQCDNWAVESSRSHRPISF